MLTHTFDNARKPARVVILGANGFVPLALGATLQANGVSTLPVGRSTVDLLDADAASRLSALLRPDDVVVMAAALTPEKGRDVGTLIKNLRMVETLSAAVKARTCAHLIYISSDAVYSFADPVITERTPPAPADLYGIMHLTREMALRDTAAKAGIPLCILRSCAIYGYGDTHNSYGPNRFMRTALEKKIIQVFGAGEETRDHVFISDVVSVIEAVILRRSTGLLNLVGGKSISFGELAEIIAGILNSSITIESLPRRETITHRSFGILEIQESLPGYCQTSISTGISKTLSARQQGRISNLG